MKKERWYVSVLHLRGRNASTLVSTEVLVSRGSHSEYVIALVIRPIGLVIFFPICVPDDKISGREGNFPIIKFHSISTIIINKLMKTLKMQFPMI